MYLLNKHIHPANFTFANSYHRDRFTIEDDQRFAVQVTGTADTIYHIGVSHPSRWKSDPSRNELMVLETKPGANGGMRSTLSFETNASFALIGRNGKEFLRSKESMSFGVCAEQWLWCFELNKDMRFYGMGEKNTPFEKSGNTYKFWTVDCWADHGMNNIRDTYYDPGYIAIPYLIIKRGNDYAGLLVDSPFCGVIGTGEKVVIADQAAVQNQAASYIYLGAEGGPPSLYIIYGPTLPELTRKLQKLTGIVERPPLWALGFHQCRWGYRSAKDLRWLADTFEMYKHPVDGLWLDIDYMDGFRVFTFDEKHFPAPARDIKDIQDRGYHVVPILDPGVKREEGFNVYESGKKRDVYCKNPGKSEFVGLVWPGYTVFPDYTTEEGAAWWAEQVESFARYGIHSAWVDMNDPSTGRISCDAMRFDYGNAPHEYYHNQYGMLMSRATRRGLENAYPNERIFLLSRSGYTGSQKWAANWTGDNFSNYFYLRCGIGKSLNLALSGMPFNGPDVGGFGGDTVPQLMIDWIKACFLFPFFRNHCAHMGRNQEPWMLGARVLKVSKVFTRLRYKLLPYLYNLFVRLSEDGEAVLRPLFYDFNESTKLPLWNIDDQFMIGPAIMQAPFLTESEQNRRVVLPKARWYRPDVGEWLEGGRVMMVAKGDFTTPLFIREGAIIPMQRGTRTNNRNDFSRIELLLCLSKAHRGIARYRYVYDDGISLDYQNGEESEYTIEACVRKGVLCVTIQTQRLGHLPVRWTPLTVEPFENLHLTLAGESYKAKARPKTVMHFGAEVPWYFWSVTKR
ncbi:MAG: hypothetical protein GF344_09315 [Chitinivibrionales bacterium]|nr:hypothetical protein [Chitinivibrionales bacterium]MBD3357050.1 hypothetical protein [Chitinivibrionales bacterium]